MIQIGQLNTLKIIKEADIGLFLDGGEHGEILLPTQYVPVKYEVGASLEVFLYLDSEDRLIATTETPFAMVGEIGLLQVVANESVGAFLDWGLPKDLLLPFAEQTKPIKVDDDVVVFIYIDKSGRISATMKFEKHLQKNPVDFSEGEKVELLIADKTNLGFKAIIEGKSVGVLYENEIFQELHYGQWIEGFIRKLRPDGKIDLGLQQTGHKAGEDIAPKILELLKQKGGHLAINDKTPAEEIYRLFGVSKKKYKIALGGLYKRRVIAVDDDGIRLVEPPPTT